MIWYCLLLISIFISEMYFLYVVSNFAWKVFEEMSCGSIAVLMKMVDLGVLSDGVTGT